MDLWTHVVVYELVDVIYVLCIAACDIYIYMFVNVESKKIKQNVASLPSGAVGKGSFAECSWQIRSATLGKIFQLGCS
jgi:hypothetical protein